MGTDTVEPPTHMIAKPGDRDSLCGAKDPVPRVWIFWAGAHVRGYNLEVCAACLAAAGVQ